MSIINQTLRELDARKPGSQPAAAISRSAHASLPRRRMGWWAAGAGTLVLAAGGVAWLLARTAETPVPVRATAPMQAVAPVRERLEAPPVQPPPALPAEAAGGVVVSEHAPAGNPVAPALPPVPQAEHRPQVLSESAMPDVQARPPAIRKEINVPSVEETAEARYRKAVELVRKGRETQARPLLEEALRLVPGHVAARQLLATLLSEAGLVPEAEAVLREGRAVAPEAAWFALGLARLQAGRGDAGGAAATLSGGLGATGVTAEYHATLAALYLQLERHAEAAQQYEQALRMQAGQGSWWVGLGLSLEAQGKTDEAKRAYRRALLTDDLPEKLVGFARAKLAE